MKRGDYALLHKEAITNTEGEPYIVRWRLIQTPLFAVYLHHILRSDDDRDLHDHPWPFVSLILRGGYWEWTPRAECKLLPDTPCQCNTEPVRTWHGPGSVLVHRGADQHRLELPEGKTTWTLVFCGRRGREWGFQTDDGWLPWREYLRRTTGQP